MKRRVSIIIFLFISLFLIFAAAGSTIVYITKTGAKYHRDGCSSLRQSKIDITLAEAIRRGYEPCRICNPPILEKQENK